MLDAETDVGRIAELAAEVDAEGRIGGAVGFGEFVIGLRLIDGLNRLAQIGAGGERDGMEVVEGIDFVGKIEGTGDVEVIDRASGRSTFAAA